MGRLLAACTLLLSFSYNDSGGGGVLAFRSSNNNSGQHHHQHQQQQQLVQRTTSTLMSSSTRLYLGVPKIDEWTILKSGAVKGTVSNHPELPDGYEITTSPLAIGKAVVPKNNAVVVTASGSKYKLLTTIDIADSKSKSNSKPIVKRAASLKIPKLAAPVVKKSTTAPVTVIKVKAAAAVVKKKMVG